MKTELTMAQEGEFLREYGKQYFIVASEALNIGRVKWNMVPIGKNGKDGIVFYMTTEQMLSLCTEIVNGSFAEKLAKDTGNYPGAYKYATGEDGSLHLNIGGGKVGCRIQMQDAKTKTNYLMAVSIESLNIMARKYLLATGLTPVTSGTYYAEVISAFEKGRVERSKFRKNEDVGDSVDVNNVVNDAEANDCPETKVEKEEANSTVEKKSESKPTTEDTGEVKNFKLLIHGEKALKKGFLTFEGKDEEGKKVSLMFRKEDAEKLSWFASFENAAATKETSITICGERKGEFILYVGPAKK